MMNKFIYMLIVVFLAVELTTSCSLKNDEDTAVCNTQEIAYATAVDAPSNGMVNQIIPVGVTFGVYNGCGAFEKFLVTERPNNILDFEIIAAYNGCICTQNASLINATYNFIPRNSGNYTLNFKRTPTDFTSVSILVN